MLRGPTKPPDAGGPGSLQNRHFPDDSANSPVAVTHLFPLNPTQVFVSDSFHEIRRRTKRE